MSDNAQLATVDENPAPAHSNSNTTATPMAMVQMAVEQGADIDKLEKLMALQERWEANEARKAFDSAMAAFKADPPKITKNRHVKFQTQKGVTEYDHATLDHVAEEIGKAMAPHGLSFRWQTEQQGEQIYVTCIVSHIYGHSESVTLNAAPDGSGQKNSIQQVGSTITYLQRYTLLAATGLAAADQDDDGRSAGAKVEDTITQEQADEIRKAAKVAGVDDVDGYIYDKKQVPTVEQLPASSYKAALQHFQKMATSESEGE